MSHEREVQKMRMLKRVAENLEDMRFVVAANSPNNPKRIRIEHYSQTNDNRILFDDSCCIDGVIYPIRVNIGASLAPNIIFVHATPSARKTIQRDKVRERIQRIYQKWVNTDEEFLELYEKMA